MERTTTTPKTTSRSLPSSPRSNRCSLFAFGSVIVLFQCISVFRQDLRIQQSQESARTPTSRQEELATSSRRRSSRIGGRELLLSSPCPVTSTNTTTASSAQEPRASIPFDWNVNPVLSKDTPTTWEDPSFSPKQPINFVHIPKNGGSSVVQAAIDAGLNWGDCLFQQHWPGRSCSKPPPQPSANDDKGKKNKKKGKKDWLVLDTNWTLEGDEFGRVWWHIPIPQLEAANKYNPYEGYDLFAIVRNPYDRAVSEFYYHCDAFPNLCKGLEGRRSSRVLNRNIQKACKTLLMAQHKSVDYFLHWGHWIPQYDFFFRRNGKRLIDHLLHKENLDAEFQSLMKAYNLSTSVKLPPHPIKKRNDHRMTIHNLTLATIKFIEVVYQHDFEIGGYEMWSPKLSSYYAASQQQQQQPPPQQQPDKEELTQS